MIDIAAGQNTTFFIARPPPTEAAKDEAKKLESVPEPTIAAPAPVAPVEDAPVDSPSTGFKPSIDLSGFGFAFGGPPPAANSASPAPANSTPTSNSKAASPGISEEQRKKNAVGISRTVQSVWEELPRFPEVEDPQDECVVCNRIENESKGDSLECEKVRLFSFFKADRSLQRAQKTNQISTRAV